MTAFTTTKFAALVAVSMVALSSALPQGEAPTCARTYSVQSGDWCDKISAEQHSST